MKVRHKRTGEITEVLGFVPAHEYEIVRDHTVPVTSWQDVTGECSTYGDPQRPCLGIAHHTDPIYRIWKTHGDDLDTRYRLRKVRLKQEAIGNAFTDTWAFIVERKVE